MVNLGPSASAPLHKSGQAPLRIRLLLSLRIPHIITHFEQHPASASLSLTSIGLTGPAPLDMPLVFE